MYRLKEGRISSHGVFSIVVILLITKLFLGVPRVLIEEGGAAGWLLITISATMASVGVFFIVKLIKRFPKNSIIEIAEKLWGTPGRIFVALSMSFLFLYTSTIVVREFAETILTTALPRTPISVITFMFVAAMVMGAYNGLEVITRSAVLVFPFIILGLLSILLLAGSFIDVNNLFPVFGTGIVQIAANAPLRTSMFSDIVLITLIAANINDPEKVPGQIWKSFIFSVIMILLVHLLYLTVMSSVAATKLLVPVYQIARIIYMGRFIQRIEAIYIFIWFFTGALQLTLSMYGAVTALARGFKIPIYQPMLFPLGLLVFSLSFLPHSIISAVYWDIEVLRKYSFVLAFGLPAALFLTSVISKKGGNKGDPQKAN